MIACVQGAAMATIHCCKNEYTFDTWFTMFRGATGNGNTTK
jgi:hypothetical protein